MLVVAAVLVVPWMAPTAPEVAARSSSDRDVAGTEGCGHDWSSADLIDRLDDLPEVSGFASSARYPGLAWMIRDSKNPDSLYSFRLDGDDHASWKEFPVLGSASNRDWEDVTYTVGSDGRGRLWILENDFANLSDNSSMKLYEVLEPDPERDRTARLAGTYRFGYPGGENFDTESLFALGGDLFAVTKTNPNRVFRFPEALSRSGTNRLTEMGGLDASSLITAVGASGDERLLVTVGITDRVSVFENQGFASEFSAFDGHEPIFRKAMPNRQREAIDFFPYEGCDIISVSEDGTVWRLSNPNTLHPAGRPGAPTAVSATAGDGMATVRWSPPLDTGGMITGYRVTAFQDAVEVATVTTPDGAATSAVMTGLANGTAYTFTVTALNVSGAGLPSAPSAAVTPDVAADPGAGRTPAGDSGVAGYWLLDADGTIYPFGAARHFGDATADLHAEPAVDLEPTPSGAGYWVLDDRGRVYVHGDAGYFGDADRSVLAAGEQVTSLSATPAGDGYWIFTSRGRVQAFGAARHLGDMAKVKLNGPVLDSVATPTGAGYYMVAADGGIFTFGDAVFHGSMGATRLNAPVQSLVPDGDGTGYWLVASDGGVFTFEAPFLGSLGSIRLNKPITGMVRFGNGYLMVGEDGGIFNFSDLPFSGSLGARPPATPVVAVAALD
jgi:hypothetical protein